MLEPPFGVGEGGLRVTVYQAWIQDLLLQNQDQDQDSEVQDQDQCSAVPRPRPRPRL